MLYVGRPSAPQPAWDTDGVGDQAPIPIESRVTTEPEAAESGSGAGGRGASSRRVVQEPGRWPRLAAIVAVVGLVAGGLVWAVRDGGTAPSGPADDEAPALGPQDTPGGAQAAATRVAFAEAIVRFGEVESFGYRGSVQDAASGPFGTGPWIAADVDVEGAVLLQHDLARDVAVDGSGRWVETLRSGGTVWSRSAPSARALDDAPWEVAVPDGLTLDAATVVRALRTAGNPRGEAPDAAGRPVIRATLREREVSGSPAGPLPGAEVLLSLDDAGDIVHIRLVWPGADPRLVVDLEISDHDQPPDIAPPDTGPAALRRTVPVAALEAAGVRPLDLGRVPAGWRLVGASLGPEATAARGCSVLNLRYAAPHAAAANHLFLRVTSENCGGLLGELTGPRQPLTAGAFEGSFTQAESMLAGAVFDGTAAVGFETDLPVDDLALLLRSLRPFDPDLEPDPVADLPAP